MRPGIQPAARQRHIADAGLRCVPEPHSDGAFIILSEEGIVNVVSNLLPVLIPVRQRLLPGDAHQLRMKPDKAAHTVVFSQHVRDSILTARVERPRLRRERIAPRTRVRYVEHITQLRHVAGAVNQGDALCTATHIPAHPLIPQFVGRAGRRIRALSEDHQLILIAVLVQPRGRVKKRAPAVKPGGDLPRGLDGQLLVGFEFWGHVIAPFPCSSWFSCSPHGQAQACPFSLS